MQISQAFVLTLAMAATSMAFPGHYGAAEQHVDYYAYPKYQYDYAVHDLHTGDVKNKWETRDGDAVKGGYSLNEPDGTILRVEYTADKHNGFNAIVHKIGKAVHPETVKHYGGHFGGIEGGHHGHASSTANTNSIAIGHHVGH